MIVASLLWFAPIAGGQFIIEATFLDPAEHRAPSGEYVLYLNPSTPDGAGPAQYRLSHRGAVLWDTELPFTLRELGVTDAGFTVGYGLTNGDSLRGQVVVAVIASTGDVVLRERTRMTESPFFDALSKPAPQGLVLDADQKKFSVRIADPDLNRGVERWWRYALPDGTRLEELRPLEAMGLKDNEQLRLMDARAVPGTDLYLLHWWHHNFADRSRGLFGDGGVFTLMAPDGKMVWRRDLPLDYTVDGDGKAAENLERLVQKLGAIRHTGNGGHFVVWFVRESAEVTFAVQRSSESEPGWAVGEVERKPFIPPTPSAEPIAIAPAVVLAPIDSVQLVPASARPLDASANRAIVDGRICIQDRSTAALHVWHEDGALVWIGEVEPEDPQSVQWLGRVAAAPDGSLWAEARDDQYLGWDQQGARLGFCSFDLHPLFPPTGDHVWTWGRHWGLSLREESGAELVRVARQPDNRWLRGIQSAVFLDSGELAVLSGTHVFIYSASGEPLRSIPVPVEPEGQGMQTRGDWLLLSEARPHVFLVRRSTGAALRFRPPAAGDDENWTHGFSADGKRLLSLHAAGGKFTLHRFELP
ncbi:MAG: hypothetical protein GC161_09390 [Planctomycetaceae bacterium]|nr:hypothetical protein [Planctomycetaceae bacterium]